MQTPTLPRDFISPTKHEKKKNVRSSYDTNYHNVRPAEAPVLAYLLMFSNLFAFEGLPVRSLLKHQCVCLFFWIQATPTPTPPLPPPFPLV